MHIFWTMLSLILTSHTALQCNNETLQQNSARDARACRRAAQKNKLISASVLHRELPLPTDVHNHLYSFLSTQDLQALATTNSHFKTEISTQLTHKLAVIKKNIVLPGNTILTDKELDLLARCIRQHDIPVNAAGKYPVSIMALWALQTAANNNALFESAKSDDLLACALALARGAKINTADSFGYTALHLACLYERLAIAKLLVEHNADINAQTPLANTPLHICCQQGDHDNVIWLLQRGANTTALNNANHTAEQEAYNHQHIAIGNLLKAHREK